jgi:uncharacterized protein YndB with AHSA1/START domain
MARSPTEERPRLELKRHYPVAPEKVWRAWTDPKALSRWFGPGEPDSVTRAELDVRPGGRYVVAFRAAGEEHAVSGSYVEVVPLARLVFTWAWQSTPERVSRVTIELTANGQGTDMRLRHEQFFDAQAASNHVRGWTGTLAKLDALLGA